MPTKSLFERPKLAIQARVRCQACSDFGFIILVERTLIGVHDLLNNSAPCTCSIGDQWRKEYELR